MSCLVCSVWFDLSLFNFVVQFRCSISLFNFVVQFRCSVSLFNFVCSISLFNFVVQFCCLRWIGRFLRNGVSDQHKGMHLMFGRGNTWSKEGRLPYSIVRDHQSFSLSFIVVGAFHNVWFDRKERNRSMYNRCTTIATRFPFCMAKACQEIWTIGRRHSSQLLDAVFVLIAGCYFLRALL
jgi:hypothetical protein